MVSEVALAALFAVICWWFGTGIILWLDRLPAQSFRWSMLGWTFLLGLSFWGVSTSMKSVSDAHAYLGFGCVIVMWGWHELAFLTGTLTGPRKIAMDDDAVGFKRFAQALMVMLHHELALLLNFGVLCAMQVGQANHIALCTFALLWCMRVSAKLNLFFGVTENGAAYLPAHLAYLASYFRQRRMTWWFVISVSLSLAAWIWLITLSMEGAVEMTTGWVMLASLLTLAIVEHALMVFPLPMQRIWGWALSRTSASSA